MLQQRCAQVQQRRIDAGASVPAADSAQVLQREQDMTVDGKRPPPVAAWCV